MEFRSSERTKPSFVSTDSKVWMNHQFFHSFVSLRPCLFVFSRLRAFVASKLRPFVPPFLRFVSPSCHGTTVPSLLLSVVFSFFVPSFFRSSFPVSLRPFVFVSFISYYSHVLFISSLYFSHPSLFFISFSSSVPCFARPFLLRSRKKL